MKKTMLAASVGMAGLFLSTPSGAVELCHVANAGFLIKGENASVLIDGLMREDQYEGRFALPSEAMFGNMMRKSDVFENLQLVLSTHRHGDHFDPKATVQHMRSTEGVRYAVPADALPTLEANSLTEEEKDRLFVVEDGPQSEFSHAGISVQTFDVDHGPNQPQNVGYRVTVDGVSFFHTGDISATREQLSAAGVNGVSVDALIMPFWYGMGDVKQQATIAESWQAGRVVATHFTPDPQPWMERFGGVPGVMKMVRETHGDPLISTTEGECTDF